MHKYQEALDKLASIDLQVYGEDKFGDGMLTPLYACDCYTEQFNTLYELIDKHYKYRWHDLRKDPNNLPKNEVVNICYGTKLGYAYSSAIHNGIKWILEEVDEYLGANNEVIGWKYIERFEDE